MSDPADVPEIGDSPNDRPLAERVRRKIGHARLVGREAQLSILEEERVVAREGAFRFVLVTGQAGAGKTRLLTEFARRVSGSGGVVAHGQCLDERGMPALMPWIDICAALQQAEPRQD